MSDILWFCVQEYLGRVEAILGLHQRRKHAISYRQKDFLDFNETKEKNTGCSTESIIIIVVAALLISFITSYIMVCYFKAKWIKYIKLDIIL